MTAIDLEKKDVKLSELKWPLFQNARYNEALTRFMYSFKNIYSPNINGHSSACFLTGPSKCGKSWFLRFNMRKFESSPKKPLVFYLDLKEQKMTSFAMFLHGFESMLIDTLVKRN